MVNFKKMDEKDFVFVNKPFSENEEKEFSEFLKLRKTKLKRPRSANKTSAHKRVAV